VEYNSEPESKGVRIWAFVSGPLRFPLRVANQGGSTMPSLLLLVLVILLIAALPTWPYSAGWGYYPSGGLGTVLVIILILVLVGRI
jgi:hypothetical protein